MESFSIRWRNFRSLEDTGWIPIRPLTVLIGSNGSGKTSFLAPLLILKQTIDSLDDSLALRTRGDLFDAGSFQDAVTDRDTTRAMRLAVRLGEDLRGNDSAPLGKYPPGEVELTFRTADDSSLPVLDQFEVRDVAGRVLVSRRRQASGRYTINLQLADTEPKLREAVLAAPPVQFLFSPEPVVRAAFADPSTAKKKDSRLALRIDSATGLYFTVTSFVETRFRSILGGLSFLGPLRDHPRRVYLGLGEHPPDVGTRGEAAPEVIFRQRDRDLLERVNKWVRRFEFGVELRPVPLGPDAFAIALIPDSSGPELNLADCGFGLSQVLPLIVQGFYTPPSGFLVAEQPEIHLNPRLQTVLADLFCEVAASGRGVLLETHSEHLLLRLRRLVAEGQIEAGQVSLLYVEAAGRRSTVREIPLSRSGHIEPAEWPKGFFEDSLRESLGLASAQSRGRRAR